MSGSTICLVGVCLSALLGGAEDNPSVADLPSKDIAKNAGSPAPEQIEPLSFPISELEQRYILRSPLVLEKLEEIRALKIEMGRYEGDPGLIVNANLRAFPFGEKTADDFLTRHRYRGEVNLEWELFNEGWFENKREKQPLVLLLQALEAELQAIRLAELASFRDFYFDVLENETRVAGELAIAAILEEVVANRRSLYEAKEILMSELLSSETELVHHRQLAETHRLTHQRKLAELALRTGLLTTDIRLVRPVEQIPPPIANVKIKEQLAQHPRVVAARLRGESLVRPTEYPESLQLSFFGGYAFGEDRKRGLWEDGFQIGARFSMPLFQYRHQRTDKALMEVNQQRWQQAMLAQLRQLQDDFDRSHDAYLIAQDNYRHLALRDQTTQQMIRESTLLLENPLPESPITPLQLSQYQVQAAQIEAEREAARLELWSLYYQLYFKDHLVVDLRP